MIYRGGGESGEEFQRGVKPVRISEGSGKGSFSMAKEEGETDWSYLRNFKTQCCDEPDFGGV